jgi:hypothetical protein
VKARDRVGAVLLQLLPKHNGAGKKRGALHGTKLIGVENFRIA